MIDPADEQEALRLMQALERLSATDRLAIEYAQPWTAQAPVGPYPWQVRFHGLGGPNIERMICAANRVGKSRTAASEIAIHLTGRYPAWWTGMRYDRPVDVMVGAETNLASRDIVQLALLGKYDSNADPSMSGLGTGWLPLDSIDANRITKRTCGVDNVVDQVLVRHRLGGFSTVCFRTYEQGASKWQGTSYDIVWLDEEPDMGLFSEANMRRLDKRGMLIFTRTPLYGMSDVVKHFVDGGPGVHVVNATWDDAPHLDADAKAQLLASTPPHERETRSAGVPMMGTGAVYPIRDEDIWCDPFPIPAHFRQLVGIDFGWDHPAAGVWGAFDADTDTWYITDCYKADHKDVAYHAEQIKSRGQWIPVAWPHDGLKKDPNSGIELARQYRLQGVKMLGISARYDDKSGSKQPVDPAVQEIYLRMVEGKFKVFRHLSEWLEEKRMYHRKDGIIVDRQDDLMAATRYLIMMRRYALSGGVRDTRKVALNEYDPFAWMGG